jgi:hypothetical protein
MGEERVSRGQRRRKGKEDEQVKAMRYMGQRS